MEKEKKINTGEVLARFPPDVSKAIEEYTKDKQKEFPRYRPLDLVRSAVINHLKSKGYLDKTKDYL